MPSTCDDPKPSGWKDDIDHIAHAIEHAADRGKDIVLVMHSRGGFVGADAAKGLSKADRSDQGKPGGIVRLVYICAFAAAEGLSCWMATGTKSMTVTHSVRHALMVEPTHRQVGRKIGKTSRAR